MRKKKYLFIIISALILSLASINANAQTARRVLDKTAANVSKAKGGATASFSISGGAGSLAGSLSIKGNKFFASTGQGKVWNDGKTQWTWTRSTNEVTISRPNDAQQMKANPYKFISIYKSGYRLSMKNSGGNYQVHLQAMHPARSIQEAYITVTRSYYPTQIRMRQGKSWTTINISNFRIHSVSDGTFRFNKNACPGAEIVDLR